MRERTIARDAGRALRAAACAAALWSCEVTQAAGGTQPAPPLLPTIELWLVSNFGLVPSGAPPALRTVPAARLVELRYGPASPVQPGEVVAAYDHGSRTIYLMEGWDGSDPPGLSALVHEMVHHLQAAAGARFACPAERERLAYEAQDAWLRLFGSDLGRAFSLDPAMIFS